MFKQLRRSIRRKHSRRHPLRYKESHLMQQTSISSIPTDGRIGVTIYQRLCRVTCKKYNVTLELIRGERNVGISPPWHELAAGARRRRTTTLLLFTTLLFSATRRSIGAFQTGWRLDEAKSSEETLWGRQKNSVRVDIKGYSTIL